MSYGYRRKMSPAAMAERELRKAHRLTRLRVDECSVVDRAACPGAKIKLLKNEGRPMRTIDLEDIGLEIPMTITHKHEAPVPRDHVSIAKAATNNLRSGGDLDQRLGSEVFKRCAVEAFPLEKTEGAAMAKYAETAIGRDFQNALVRRGYVETVTRDPLGNGYEVAKLNEMDRGEPCEDVEDCDKALEALGKAVMAKLGGKMTLAQAIDYAITHTQIGKDLARKSMDRNLARQYPISP
jgi:hypothetical protein